MVVIVDIIASTREQIARLSRTLALAQAHEVVRLGQHIFRLTSLDNDTAWISLVVVVKQYVCTYGLRSVLYTQNILHRDKFWIHNVGEEDW